MKTWERVRTGWLVAALCSSAFVLAKVMISPLKQSEQASYTFPATVPLSAWKFVQSYPIAVQHLRGPSLATSVDEQSIAGRNYRYLRNGEQLDIQMRYFVNSYLDVRNILKESNLQARTPTVIRRESAIGSYMLYRRSGRLHYGACMTASGRTTVTEGELRANQNRPDILTSRAIPWLFGRAPLRDMRCLWTQVSVPLSAVAPQTQERELEQVWSEWVQWWHQHYPPEP